VLPCACCTHSIVIPAKAGIHLSVFSAVEEVLPNDADWHQIMAPDITEEKILQTV
jgi:hypothetical protein